MNKEKRVKVFFSNPEATIKFNVVNKKGDSVDTAIKIMKAFDEACIEIKKQRDKNEDNSS